MDKFVVSKTHASDPHRQCSEGRARVITNLLVQWCALDLRPLSVTQGVGFKRLMAFIEPNFTIPSRTHLMRLLRKHHGDAKEKVKALLREEADGVSLTTDAWTSNQVG